MRAGKVLYRDIWFDKPPFAPAFYTLLGGEAAGPCALPAHCTRCCAACWRGASRAIYGASAKALWAAGLLGFFLIFDFPSSVIPLAADLWMLAPHMAAVWMAYRGVRCGRRAGGRGVRDQSQGRCWCSPCARGGRRRGCCWRASRE